MVSCACSYCFTDVVTEEVDYFRVGYGEAVMPDALAAFTRFVEQHKSAWLRHTSRL